MSERNISDGKQLLVISLDGFPWSLLHHQRSNWFPRLAQRLPSNTLRSMDSVYPTVSSVAWSSYISGRNPGGHGVYGFVDRGMDPWRLILPNAANRRGPVLWETLGESGLRSIVMNIPMTYPPSPINGVLVSGFLGVNLSQSVVPASLYPLLKDYGYGIDADTGTVTENPRGFLDQLGQLVTARFKAFTRLLELNKWHFAHLHIMETDRLFHFFWDHIENSSSSYHQQILDLFTMIDRAICDLLDRISDDCELLLLSDHGFCKARMEVNLNAWLRDRGWLFWNKSGRGIERIAANSKAYSLLPGRLYLNRKDREPSGYIEDEQVPQFKMELTKALLTLMQPGSQKPVLKAVLDGAAIYSGGCTAMAPDLIAVPADGVELKGRLSATPLFQPSRLQGMHTDDDAFFWSRHPVIQPEKPSILDMYPTILRYFGLDDETANGNCIINW